MTFYGLLGVQLFGELKHHCVRKNVLVKDVTLNDLTIPDSYCNPKSDGGHKCPKGFDCLDLSELPKVKTGFLGFGEIASSIFTGNAKIHSLSKQFRTRILFEDCADTVYQVNGLHTFFLKF